MLRDLKQQNEILMEHAISAKTSLSWVCNLGYSFPLTPTAYPPPIHNPMAYLPPFHTPTMPTFTPDPSCYEVPPTANNYPEPECVTGPGPQTMQYHQENAEVEDWEEEWILNTNCTVYVVHGMRRWRY